MSFSDRLRVALLAITNPATIAVETPPTGDAVEIDPATLADLNAEIETRLMGSLRNGMTPEQIDALRDEIAARLLAG